MNINAMNINTMKKNISPRLFLSLSLSLLFLSNPTFAIDEIAPEASTQHLTPAANKSATAKQFMAVTANPHATQTAFETLKKGGSAVDAAIAAQLILGLVEPQSSGIGGGAFMLHWHQNSQSLKHFDGRETAPASVNEEHFLDSNKQRRDFFQALEGGYAVGTPGLVAMLAEAHKQHGKLPWAELFQPAITLAENGFSISPRLNALLHYLAGAPSSGLKFTNTRDYFYQADGTPKPVGTILKNPAYAATLKRLQKNYGADFYHGKIAKDIIHAVQNNSVQAGKLSLKDLANYQVNVNEPLCYSSQIKPHLKVCGAPPPSSGGSTVTQILGLMETQQLAEPLTHSDYENFAHRFIESSKLAFADRNTYIGDPHFSPFDAASLLQLDYLKQRAALVKNVASTTPYSAGTPTANAQAYQSAGSPELTSTTHLSIIDSEGNALSMTSSIETAFGSRLMVGGFLLNNQLTDFSFTPTTKDGKKIANRIQPGKRPRSSMAPTIVFENDQPTLLIGSPGGARIIDYVARPIAEYIILGNSPAEAMNTSHIIQMNRQKVELETSAEKNGLAAKLKAKGHQVKIKDQSSGISLIQINNATLLGAADSRREGTALGK